MPNRARHWPIHAVLIAVCAAMLVPFYWVFKTSIAGENLFAYPPAMLPQDPHPFYYVEAWYTIPFPRFFFNSVVVAAIVILANLVFNATAGYALTKDFPGKKAVLLLFLACMMIPFHATIIPAYLISARLGVLNTHLGLALPAFSHIICIFLFKANFEAVPASLIQAARIDGVPEWRIMVRVLLPLAKPAIATNTILSFIWSWNDFLWPLIIVRDVTMQTLPLGLTSFLAYFENATGALYAFCVMVLAPGLLVFFLAQDQFIQGLTSGAKKG
jgi:ABC-type glycerol-3-phosphate transport system permease component